MANKIKHIWTIGHSTRSIETLIEMLESFEIKQLVDVRHYPSSKKFPHFNKEQLKTSLASAGIGYHHLEALGGRRKVKPDSKNTAWRHPAFRGYADYMETVEFQKGIDQLVGIAHEERTAYMCSEAVWWRCHRSLISDVLKFHGWHVYHIMDISKSNEHPYTAPAKIDGGVLHYG